MIVTAPETSPADAASPRLFLAGGITNVEDWQAVAVGELHRCPGTLYNPRRRHYNHLDPDLALEQIEWEFFALHNADAILFWFAGGESPQPITLYELGSWARTDKPLLVGVDSSYVRSMDVHTQLRLLRPDLEISTSLEALLSRTKTYLHEYSQA